MQHLDPDRLVLHALGEDTVDGADADHLSACAACRDEVDALRHVAELSAQTQEVRDLPAPPERVWRGIAAEVQRTRPAPATVTARQPEVREPGAARPRRARRAWVRPLLAAAAAAVIAVAGTVVVVRLVQRPPVAQVTARAELAALPTAPVSARGDARVLRGAGEPERLHLHVSGLPLSSGYYQVWLIKPGTTDMVSVGMLGAGEDVLLPLSDTVDLNEYTLVDVSAEQYDGNTAHSGKSLLRGTLTN